MREMGGGDVERKTIEPRRVETKQISSRQLKSPNGFFMNTKT